MVRDALRVISLYPTMRNFLQSSFRPSQETTWKPQRVFA